MADSIPEPSRPQHLDPSPLGRREYWDEAYEREIQNHAADPEDEGIIWFSDSGAEEKMLQFIEELPYPCVSPGSDAKASIDLRVLDVGTGNGHLLFAMRDEDWQAQMVGVDYSAASVRLAQQIQRTRVGDSRPPLEHYLHGSDDINFQRWDLLQDAPGPWRGSGFELVLDKGTFDAISLSDAAVDEHGRKGCEVYASKVAPLVKHGGFLVVTSCNWTEPELARWFQSPLLRFERTIRYPTFTFGGKSGQTVSSVCFRRTEARGE